MLSLIAAISENDVIGLNGRLPWRLPDDMKHFKDLTMGKPVIMGRKTFESIGRPLPNRCNIVITRQTGWSVPGCAVVHSLDEALERASSVELPASCTKEVFVMGGAEVYREALPRANRLYLTRVHAVIEGDAFFPEVNWSEWKEIGREEHATDDRHAYPFTFFVYERVR